MGQLSESGPATGGIAITASDSTTYDPPLRGVFVGGAGNLNVTGVDGVAVLFTGVVAGSIIPIACTQVLSTSTTATNMTGFK